MPDGMDIVQRDGYDGFDGFGRRRGCQGFFQRGFRQGFRQGCRSCSRRMY